jgi:hypothetical protein
VAVSISKEQSAALRAKLAMVALLAVSDFSNKNKVQEILSHFKSELGF